MNGRRKTALERMDALVRWTGVSETVRRDMSSDPEASQRHRPMRWLPLLAMACGAGFIVAALVLPVPFALYGIVGTMTPVLAGVHARGPLGKPSMDDDERERALRKDAFLFCLAVLAFANIVGQPVLTMTAALYGWPFERISGVAFAAFICNLAWFCSLPTLYASWKLPGLAED
jgi:hypothetical protein